MWKSEIRLNQLYRSSNDEKEKFNQIFEDEQIYEILELFTSKQVPESEIQKVHNILLMNSKVYQHIVGDVAQKMKAFFVEKTWESYYNLYDILPEIVQSQLDMSVRILAQAYSDKRET